MESTKIHKPRILITVPTLGKRLDLLEETLKSITEQKNIKVDIILVFPKNQKSVNTLVQKYKTLKEEDPGTLSGALNIGVKKLKNKYDYFGWLGDDDLLYDSSLETTSKLLEKNPEAVIAYGGCDYIDSSGVKIYTNHSNKYASWVINWGPNIIPLPGMLYRAESLIKVGYFNTKLKYAMDLEMLLRLKKLGKFTYSDKTLAAFRWHPSSTTVANRQNSLKEARMIKKQFLPKYIKPISIL